MPKTEHPVVIRRAMKFVVIWRIRCFIGQTGSPARICGTDHGRQKRTGRSLDSQRAVWARVKQFRRFPLRPVEADEKNGDSKDGVCQGFHSDFSACSECRDRKRRHPFLPCLPLGGCGLDCEQADPCDYTQRSRSCTPSKLRWQIHPTEDQRDEAQRVGNDVECHQSLARIP
jgi:hypothetical protein